ncbi:MULTISPECIES: multidrug effflux MFS transporter [Pantoea]|uniref:multidrug effflux MFS transporter n=1 Tax=Pantoea TaxID=53335 RepID=UPI001562B002|nr:MULTISPECIES: multidrug effflux MFS transporter [Pantoea]MDF7788068.1 multidrug effflux MFS transporter [Pantoea stewartii]WRH23192.1 MFS transporter [Pantoea sp. JZ29]
MPSLPNKQSGTLSVGIIIVLLVAMGQFNNTLFIPSLPHMRSPLGTTDALLQLSVTLTLVSFGLAQLFYGPLSDYYGRRPVALIGLSIFFLGNLACFLATSGPAFLAGKIVTGLGVGCVGPIARAIARDMSHGKKLLKLMGILVMFMSVTPAVSPMAGGAIQGFFGWRINFATLCVVAFCFIVYLYFSLPETNENVGDETNRFTLVRLGKNYRDIFSHGEFMRMALFNMLGYAAELVFLLSASYILQDNFHLSPQEFGLVPLAIVPCVMVGNFIVSKLSARFEVTTICTLGVLLILTGSVSMLILSKMLPNAIISFVVPMMIVALGEGIVTPSSTARCMDLYGKKAGYAGAAVGAIAMTGAGCVIALSTLSPLRSALDVSVELLIISFLLLALCMMNFTRYQRERA